MESDEAVEFIKNRIKNNKQAIRILSDIGHNLELFTNVINYNIKKVGVLLLSLAILDHVKSISLTDIEKNLLNIDKYIYNSNGDSYSYGSTIRPRYWRFPSDEIVDIANIIIGVNLIYDRYKDEGN